MRHGRGLELEHGDRLNAVPSALAESFASGGDLRVAAGE